MLAEYLVRGVKAGVVAGLVFGLFVALVANPLVGVADGLARHDTAGDHDGAVPTAVERAAGIVAGVLWGVLLGALVFGLAHYLLEPVFPASDRAGSLLLAAAGFVTVSGAPWLALPPLAPGVERTIATGTGIAVYGGMAVAGAGACLLSGLAYGRLRGRGRVVAAAGAAAPFGALPVVAALVPAGTVAGSTPTGVATAVTGAVVFGQILLWASLAVAHARLLRGGDAPASAATLAESGAAGD